LETRRGKSNVAERVTVESNVIRESYNPINARMMKSHHPIEPVLSFPTRFMPVSVPDHDYDTLKEKDTVGTSPISHKPSAVAKCILARVSAFRVSHFDGVGRERADNIRDV
jgi:hypothetical protein